MESSTHQIASVTIAGERMELLAEKAIYLPAHDMLLIADLHFGKIEHFRKNGIALPASAARKDIHRLSQLIEKMDAGHIVFMGDLFHSDYNNAWISFKEMLDKHYDRKFTLIIGNHDILDEQLYSGMDITYKLEVNDLILTHEPQDVIIEGKYNLCGHIHPGVRLKGKGRQSVRIPCYFFGQHTGILPSYGSFTGTHVLSPLEGDQVFVVDGEIVMEV